MVKAGRRRMGRRILRTVSWRCEEHMGLVADFCEACELEAAFIRGIRAGTEAAYKALDRAHDGFLVGGNSQGMKEVAEGAVLEFFKTAVVGIVTLNPEEVARGVGDDG